MEQGLQMFITILCSVLASSGFWSYIQKRNEKNDNRTKLLIGLAHDRIVYLGMRYIERGYITKDEYENLNDYLYKPYTLNGGNGTAEKVMNDVKKLPMYNSILKEKELEHER